MTNAFFIIGLPRSRTTWLSLFFSSNDYVCHHEAFGDYTIPEWKKYVSNKYRPVGNSDSSAVFFLDQITEEFPDSPILTVRRPVKEVHFSLIETIGLSSVYLLYEHSELLDQLEKEDNVHSIDFHNITEDTLKEAFKFLLPEFPWPKERFDLMKNMNIQPNEINLDKIPLGLLHEVGT